jgi:hypothetical protein
MNSERAFLRSFRRLTTLLNVSVKIRGELAIGAHLHATNLYSVGPFGS